MAKNQHLTLSERIVIETGLRSGAGFRAIARELDKSPSTVSREVKAHSVTRVIKVPHRHANACLHRRNCPQTDLCLPCRYKRPRSSCSLCSTCNERCPDFVEEICPRLQRSPYVCNGCSGHHHCTLRRRIYEAETAHHAYTQSRSEVRSGDCLTGEERQRLDERILPGLRQGHSLYAIHQDLKDRLPCGISTLYRLIDDGELDARNLDLPRKVRLKPGRPKRKHKVDQRCYVGRDREDFQNFLRKEEPALIVQGDPVEGKKGGAVVLSPGWVSHHRIRLHKREQNNAHSVKEILDAYEETLGLDGFRELFPVLLVDRGSEFTDPLSPEFSPFTKERRTGVFYCDPMRADRKGSLEALHRDVRRILPKGKPIDPWTQERLNEACDHLNSYPGKALKDTSPYVSFAFYMGQEWLRRLQWQLPEVSKICLTPTRLPDK